MVKVIKRSYEKFIVVSFDYGGIVRVRSLVELILNDIKISIIDKCRIGVN